MIERYHFLFAVMFSGRRDVHMSPSCPASPFGRGRCEGTAQMMSTSEWRDFVIKQRRGSCRQARPTSSEDCHVEGGRRQSGRSLAKTPQPRDGEDDAKHGQRR